MQMSLEHKFVKSAPRVLEPGVLYLSLEYGTVVHSCCCGCGTEVVTPLSPTDWKMTYDGVSVSLHPSIGNWNLKCRSHYVIRQGQVIPAGTWSQEQIESERLRDKRAKARFYGTSPQPNKTKNPSAAPARPSSEPDAWGHRFATWLKSLFK